MTVNTQGQIIDETGNPTGGQVDVKTGQIITASPGSSTPTSQSSSIDTFLKTLQDKLLSSPTVSSLDTGIEAGLPSIIKKTQEAGTAMATRTASEFERQIAETRKVGAERLTVAEESQRGFATNTAQLRSIQESTDKEVKDLEQRKSEALLLGDSTTANRISELQMKSIEFNQQAKQQAFSNMLGMATFALSAQTQERLAREQTTAEKKAVADIALKYGVEASSNDTIDTITAKAFQSASEQQKAELLKTRSETALKVAEAQKALRGEEVKTLDPFTLDILSDALVSGNTQFLAGLKTNEQFAQVFEAGEKKKTEIVGSLAKNAFSRGLSMQQWLKEMENSPSAYDTTLVHKIAIETFANKETPAKPKKEASPITIRTNVPKPKPPKPKEFTPPLLDINTEELLKNR